MPALPLTRRRFLISTSAAALLPRPGMRADLRPMNEAGYVVGEPVVEGIGDRILAEGGNAVDALVATALAGAITHPHQTGIGGYGMHGIFAMDGRRIMAVDANSTAPSAFTAEIFKPGADGKVPGAKNEHGWLAAGVPGVIAGLYLALDEFGTMPFSDVLQPAIKLAREGVPVTKALADIFARSAPALKRDPGSAKLFLPGGASPQQGSLWKNPDLAEMLTTLAAANSIEPFYRGDIAQRIAEAFAKNGGLVTTEDLAAYRARLVTPLKLDWDGLAVHTPPLTCGGLTVLQMLTVLKAMQWDKMPDDARSVHARIEAMRLAWRDRLTLLGDPAFVTVQQGKLLSEAYAADCAERILSEVKAGRVIDYGLDPKTQGGTLNFSACDKHGNIAALTLTHGNSFGAQVTVDGLGLVLGHGMSRFDPQPDHPNAPGPGKRPLHNMVPVIITQDARPVVAIGGRGGRKIPNAMFEFLTQFVVRKRSFAESLAAPRLHTEGAKVIEFQKGWEPTITEALTRTGYTMKPGGSATLSGVALENGRWSAGMQ